MVTDSSPFEFEPHSLGIEKVQVPVEERLISLFAQAPGINGARFKANLKEINPIKGSNIDISRDDSHSINLKVPLPNKPAGKEGEYFSYEVRLRPMTSGVRVTEVAAALYAALRAGPVERSTASEPIGHLVQDTKKVLAETLRAIYLHNSTSEKPRPAVQVVAEVTRDTRHPTAIRKRVEQMEEKGYLTRSGKRGIVVVYGLTERAAKLIKDKLGVDIDLKKAVLLAEKPIEPPVLKMSFDEILGKLVEKQEKYQEMAAGAPALRAEIAIDEAALNVKKDRLKLLERAEQEGAKLTKQLAGLISR